MNEPEREAEIQARTIELTLCKGTTWAASCREWPNRIARLESALAEACDGWDDAVNGKVAYSWHEDVDKLREMLPKPEGLNE